MEVRFQNSPKETAAMNTAELRSIFLIEDLMKDDQIKLVYSHYDRVIIGGVKPVSKSLQLETDPELRADYFLERRELGVINVGGAGIIKTDDQQYELNKLDCVYLGKGIKQVSFESKDNKQPS